MMNNKITDYEVVSKLLRQKYAKDIIRASKTNKGIDDDITMALDAGYIDALDHRTDVQPRSTEYWMNRSIQVVLNAGLVQMALRRMKNLVKDTPDAEDIANLALVKAIDIFDPNKGFAFSTLAYRIIQNEIIAASKKSQRQLVEDEPVPLYSSENLVLVRVTSAKDVRKVRGLTHKTFFDLVFLNMDREEVSFDRIFDFDERTNILGSFFKKGSFIGRHLQPKYKPLSLDQTYDTDDQTASSLADNVEDHRILPDDSTREKQTEIKKAVFMSLRTLNRTERTVFNLAYPLDGRAPLGMSLIAKELGISTGKTKSAKDRAQIIVREALVRKGLDLDVLDEK